MGMYASNFAKAGYRTLDEVTKLSEAELLSKVEVRLVGHRHKIYQRIKEMNEHMQIARDQKSMRIWTPPPPAFEWNIWRGYGEDLTVMRIWRSFSGNGCACT